MVDKNNKNSIKENKQSFDDSTPPSKKFRLMIFIFILGIAVFAALYLNFQTSYQSHQSSPDIKTHSSEAIITNVIKKTSLPEQQVTPPSVNVDTQQVQQSKNLEKQEADSNKTNILSQCKCSQSCSALLEFTQDYLLLKNNVIAGNNFSNQVTNLTQYTISSEELKQNLVGLLDFSKHNHSYEYFKERFKTLIKPLYKHSKQFFSIDLRDYIFIRKIDDRAMQQDDLDKVVFIISQALENSNLVSAAENLNKLPQDIESINLFTQEIENKINIENNIVNIENILLNKPDCSIVSK